MYKNIRLYVLFLGMVLKYRYKTGDKLKFVLFLAADENEKTDDSDRPAYKCKYL